MSRHEGVSCDVCMKSNFSGRRYKCLICYDFDLCAECHDSGQSGNNHNANHAVQCILTRNDFELFYGSEPSVTSEHPQSLACPFCRQLGFTDTSLHEHVASEHAHTHMEVICPVCAATPHGDPNRMTEDLASHLAMEHVSRRDTTHEESRAPRRLPHASMRGSAGFSRNSRGRGTSGNQHLAFVRESASASDPITELLSQLGGMRRASSNYSSTLQQIQQLQQQLGRGGAPRRAIVMSAGRDRGASSGEGPYGELWWDEIAAATGGRPAAIILEDGHPAAAVTASTAAAIKEELRSRAAGQSASTGATAATTSSSSGTQSEGTGKHLLTKLQEESMGEATAETELAERREFMEELFLSTLTRDFLDMEVAEGSKVDAVGTSSGRSKDKAKSSEKSRPDATGDGGRSSGCSRQRAVVQPNPARPAGNPVQSVTVNYGITGSSAQNPARTVLGNATGIRPTARVNPSSAGASSTVQNQPVSSSVSASVSVSGPNANTTPSPSSVQPLGNHNANHGTTGSTPPRPLQPVNQQINVAGRQSIPTGAGRGRGRGIRASENTPAL